MTARKIAIVTGSRADFGHLTGLAHAVQNDPVLELLLIVTGTHLSQGFGATLSEVFAQGLAPAAQIDMQIDGDTGTAIATSMGKGVAGFADTFERLAPDVIVLLGDRYEILAAAVTALMQSIPIVHIHGGETTAGATDESIRHAISKMASVHLVAAEPYRKRLIRMGEDPTKVFNFGAPAVEAIKRMDLLSKKELETSLAFSLDGPLAVVTFHPATRSIVGSAKEAEIFVTALSKFPQLQIVLTGVNADAGGREVAEVLTSFAGSAKDRVKAVTSLGHLRYISLLACADVMIGNSSSGYIEAPVFGLPVVDVGDRQTGRIAASCVQHVAAEESAITAAIETALSPGWRNQVAVDDNPYDSGTFAARAVGLLKTLPLGASLLRKTFYDGAAA